MYMNAVILAGGYGSRLAPLTNDTSKLMLPVANRPMIDYTIAHLSDFGVKDYVFTLGYQPDSIIEWAIGYRNITCHFSIESEALGTLGGIKAASDFLDDIFIVCSGDVIEDINIDAMINKHLVSGAEVTMAITQSDNVEGYGIVEVDSWGKVSNFIEKPQKKMYGTNYVNCGIYIVNKSILKYVPDKTKYDFGKDLFPSLASSGGLSAYIHDGYWSDIGTIGNYFRANFDMLNKQLFKEPLNAWREDYLSHCMAGEVKSLVSTSAKVVGDIKNSIVGKNSKVASSSILDNCIVLDNVLVIGRHRNCIVGNDFIISLSDIIDNSVFKHSTTFANKFY